MILNIELPDELGTLLRKDAEAQGVEPGVLLLSMVKELYGDPKEAEDPNAIAEIREALLEVEAGIAYGERGLSVDEAFAELERRASLRNGQQLQKAA